MTIPQYIHALRGAFCEDWVYYDLTIAQIAKKHKVHPKHVEHFIKLYEDNTAPVTMQIDIPLAPHEPNIDTDSFDDWMNKQRWIYLQKLVKIHGDNITRACKATGIGRVSYYLYKKRYKNTLKKLH